jgi:hypothetical protein
MNFKGRRWLLAAGCAVLMASSGAANAAASGATANAAVAVAPEQVAKSAPAAGTSTRTLPPLARMSQAPDSAAEDATGAALRVAKATGKPVVITALTTPTSQTLALPSGGLKLQENVLPVRVRQSGRWAPVSTALRPASGGMLRAAALPGDSVSFSGGGTGPAAVISAGGARLALSWPGPLPAPRVAGAAATYANVLPGVDLVLTATSGEAGGFSEVLVVHDAAAARDPALASLTLPLSGQGTGPVTVSRDGSVAVAATGGAGYFTAPAAVMWDSASESLAALAGNWRARAAADRAAGGFLAGSRGAGALTSSAAGPGAAARMAAVNVTATGDKHGGLVLRPDRRLMTSGSTVFPLYIDPEFQLAPAGVTQGYDEVQDSCPTASHWGMYPSLGVGYNPWGDCNGIPGNAYALYNLQVPSQIRGQHVCTTNPECAQVESYETYSSGCGSSYTASVTLSMTHAIDSATDWSNAPGVLGSAPAVTVGPDTATNSSGYTNCDGVEDDSGTAKWVPVNFDVRTFMTSAAAGSWAMFTIRLWEPGGPTDGTGWKRFSDNPTLVVEYNDTPQAPYEDNITTGSTDSGGFGCATSQGGAPDIGASASVNGPYLWAKFNDEDGDTVTGTFTYWDATKNGSHQTLSAGSGLDGSSPHGQRIPSSFMATTSTNDILEWTATANDGWYQATSKPCYAKIDKLIPDPPDVSVSPSGDIPVGSTATLSISSGNPADPAVEFAWGFDQEPATTNPPAAQTCTTTSTRCKVSSGAATLTLTVPSAGPHYVWIYEKDAAGNISADARAAFSGSDVVNAACTNVTFSAALTGPCANQMISDAKSSSGDANGDGVGSSIPYAQVEAAGWQPQSAVTVDGASFTLPDFGTHANDNVLAGGQTITMSGQGSALVFLTTSTDAYAGMPAGEATNTASNGDVASELTVPYVPGGTPVTGNGCSVITGQDINDLSCQAASGEVTYASGCGLATQSYILTAPDWITGPSDTSVLQVPDNTGAGGGLSANAPKLYAFAVPLQPGCQVTSVTLPYVGSSVDPAVSGGVTAPSPALHIFGMSIRNTTTSTPESDGTQGAVASGQAWTAAFTSPVERSTAQPGGAAFSKESIRMAVVPEAPAPAGAQVRIRLEDPMFQAGTVGAPLMIGHATIGRQSAAGSPAATAGTLTSLTFGGGANSAAAVIPEGGDIYSNPVSLPFAVSQGQGLLVTLYLENGAGGTNVPAAVSQLPSLGQPSGAESWDSAPGSGDQAGDQAGSSFTATGAEYEGGVTRILTSVDVTEPAGSLVVKGTDEGMPAIIVAGDGVILGGSGQAIARDRQPPDFRIAGQLAGTVLPSSAYAGEFSAVDEGIEGNQLQADGSPVGGVSLLARLDRDVLAEPDVGGVILNEGLQDILGGATSAQFESAAATLSDELGTAPGFDIPVIIADLTPCGGSTSLCTTGADGFRATANTDLGDDCGQLPGETNLLYCATVSFDQAISGGGTPEALRSSDGESDHLNLTAAGYAAAAATLSGLLYKFDENPFTLP